MGCDSIFFVVGRLSLSYSLYFAAALFISMELGLEVSCFDTNLDIVLNVLTTRPLSTVLYRELLFP